MAARKSTVLTVDSKELRRLQAEIRRLNPTKRTEVLKTALLKSAFVVQTNAQNAIKRGGKAKPLKTKLTSRTGTGRRSITVERQALPISIDIGTNLRYMQNHETGGTFEVPTHTRKFSAESAIARKRTSFTVKAHTITFPKRPFLAPGLKKSIPKVEEIWFRELKKMIETA